MLASIESKEEIGPPVQPKQLIREQELLRLED
jgi:hypothetical protein